MTDVSLVALHTRFLYLACVIVMTISWMLGFGGARWMGCRASAIDLRTAMGPSGLVSMYKFYYFVVYVVMYSQCYRVTWY